MRGEAIVEIAGSLIIAALTGLCAFGGLAFAAYAFVALHPSMKLPGLILLFFGIVNLPIFLLWCRETAREMTKWSHSL
jgi:hypothetical protein